MRGDRDSFKSLWGVRASNPDTFWPRGGKGATPGPWGSTARALSWRQRRPEAARGTAAAPPRPGAPHPATDSPRRLHYRLRAAAAPPPPPPPPRSTVTAPSQPALPGSNGDSADADRKPRPGPAPRRQLPPGSRARGHAPRLKTPPPTRTGLTVATPLTPPFSLRMEGNGRG